jgi:hypothetical protein
MEIAFMQKPRYIQKESTKLCIFVEEPDVPAKR